VVDSGLATKAEKTHRKSQKRLSGLFFKCFFRFVNMRNIANRNALDIFNPTLLEKSRECTKKTQWRNREYFKNPFLFPKTFPVDNPCQKKTKRRRRNGFIALHAHVAGSSPAVSFGVRSSAVEQEKQAISTYPLHSQRFFRPQSGSFFN